MWDFDEGTAQALAKGWWMLAIRGLVALAFGLVALFWPGMALGALIVFYAIFMLFDGAFAIGAALGRSSWNRAWLPLLIVGLVSLLAGVFSVIRPGLTDVALLYLIAGWAIVSGMIEIITSFKLRQFLPDELLWVSTGILSLLFGLLLVILPSPSAGLWLVASFAFVHGILQLAFAFRLRRGGTHISAVQ